MTISILRLKVAVAILLGVILFSYAVNWHSVNQMYEHIVAANKVTNQLTAGEQLYSSTLVMFLIATNMHSTEVQGNVEKLFIAKKQAASDALQFLLQDSAMHTEERGDTFLTKKVSQLVANYMKLQQSAEIVLYQSTSAQNKLMMTQAHSVLNSIFRDYSQIQKHHKKHQKELTEFSKSIWKKATTILMTQITIGILLIILVTLYLDRVVVKMFEVTERLALHDKLTGALNRNALNRIMQKKYSGKQLIQNYSIVLLDIDHFKLINDTYGHDVGDIALKEVVKTITNTIRSQDKIIRFGGEEFLVILSSTNKTQAAKVGEKIRQAIEIKTIALPNSDASLQLTISAGVATSNNKNTFEAILKQADVRLFKAKDSGRNTVIAD